jgi:RNA polymerase sigma-70 factor (ECF subfamily)
MTPPSDWRLERYRPLLRLLARQIQLDPRLRRRLDSSDLVQDALLKAHMGLDQFRGTTEAELIAWLQAILKHVVLDAFRRESAQRRDPAVEQSLHTVVEESSARLQALLVSRELSPAEGVERHEVLLRIAASLDQLPQDQRDAVVLRDMMGTPVVEIAERLGRTEKSVAGLLQRGRRWLRELLAPCSDCCHARLIQHRPRSRSMPGRGRPHVPQGLRHGRDARPG